jgi:metal-responsive CopG/Arc/MetJ family transcriptional regulator
MDAALVSADIVRRSVSIPSEMAEKIDAIAASRRVSANRAIVDLLADAIMAHEERRKGFLDLADRFQKSKDPAETKRLREKLARITFGG